MSYIYAGIKAINAGKYNPVYPMCETELSQYNNSIFLKRIKPERFPSFGLYTFYLLMRLGYAQSTCPKEFPYSISP